MCEQVRNSTGIFRLRHCQAAHYASKYLRLRLTVPPITWFLSTNSSLILATGLIAFLTDLQRFEVGRKVLLLWDGLPAHRSRCMQDWIARQRAWLTVERLPSYAPELNPTEQVFGNLKSTELANLCSDTIGEVEVIAEDGLHRIGSDTRLCFAFLRHSGLTL
jgi:transposase